MSINLTDELNAATKKGKIAAAKQVFLDGDSQNVQKEIEDINARHDTLNSEHDELNTTVSEHATQIANNQSQIAANKSAQDAKNDSLDANMAKLNTRDDQITELVKGVTATGGASVATAVSYDNASSNLDAATAQGAIDELATKKLNKTDIVQEFGDAEDKVVSQFALPFRYIQNEEFIFAQVDANNKLLFGIQQDGTPVFGKASAVEDSLQSQVNLLADKITTILGDDDTTSAIDTLKELRDFFANIDNTQTLTSILANLNSLNTKFGEDIKNLQDTKVDKEEGKSLIENEIKECFKVIENEEFLKAIVDSDDRVLFGFYRATGKPYYPLNEMYHVIKNEEYFAAWLDTDDKVVLGIRRDGEIIGEIHAVNTLKQVISQIQSDLASLQEKVGTIDTNLKELLDIFSIQENPEYLAVEKDADGKILSTTYNDGSHYSHNLKSETLDAKVDKEEGKSLIDSNVADAHSTLEDPEKRMEIVTDADGKVMSYRDADGKKHEHDMEVTNLDVSNLNLQGNSVNNIQDALKANGFDVKTPIDWSESSFIQIPEPRFAIINVTNIDSMPTTKTQNKKAFLEFWDMHGNYFKKHAILNAQGRSSMGFPKKNVAIDFCDDEWVGDETPKIRIGSWVPQDSFHLKANYTDFFRGIGCVSYGLYEDIVKTRGNMYDRPWKKALLDMSKIDVTTKSIGNQNVGNYDLLTDTGARCFPAGFPLACYLNGEFYGVFSWQLKKHRDNYHMDKSTAEHVHLDGIIRKISFWGDSIDWSQFEVRNPKNLYAIGGNKYDADVKQEEIAGEDEVNAWIKAGELPDGTKISSKVKKNLQMTTKVKKYILNFSQFLQEVKSAEETYNASNKSEADLNTFKKVFEKYWDVDNVIDYIIVSTLICNWDGVWGNNWQLFTYDGRKWWIGLYDVDGTFGNFYTGDRCKSPMDSYCSASKDFPFGYITSYYTEELNVRYKVLADCGIIDYRNIFERIHNWTMRIGTDFYKEEYKKWADSPCISESEVRNDYWELIVDSHNNPETSTTETFDATNSYTIGDEVSFGIDSNMGFFKFRCVKETTGLPTNVPHEVSTFSPIRKFKHCDSLYRVEKWVYKDIINMDKIFNYTRIN